MGPIDVRFAPPVRFELRVADPVLAGAAQLVSTRSGRLAGEWNHDLYDRYALHRGGSELQLRRAGDYRIFRVPPQPCREPQQWPETVAEWFNTCAFQRINFSTTAAGVYGNEGRNVVQGPGLAEWDFSAFKNIPVAESQTLQFRAEFFNLFNHPNFRLPNSDISSPTFGQIQQALSPRLIQFALKYLF